MHESCVGDAVDLNAAQQASAEFRLWRGGSENKSVCGAAASTKQPYAQAKCLFVLMRGATDENSASHEAARGGTHARTHDGDAPACLCLGVFLCRFVPCFFFLTCHLVRSRSNLDSSSGPVGLWECLCSLGGLLPILRQPDPSVSISETTPHKKK